MPKVTHAKAYSPGKSYRQTPDLGQVKTWGCWDIVAQKRDKLFDQLVMFFSINQIEILRKFGYTYLSLLKY